MRQGPGTKGIDASLPVPSACLRTFALSRFGDPECSRCSGVLPCGFQNGA
jgi:hypothetical protein